MFILYKTVDHSNEMISTRLALCKVKMSVVI